ncbi:MAG: hypothetical protein WC406_07335 [Methanoregula sp.]|nr:hypothetical protein [Methanoregula sp.]
MAVTALHSGNDWLGIFTKRRGTVVACAAEIFHGTVPIKPPASGGINQKASLPHENVRVSDNTSKCDTLRV